ncbi:hypothetical protein [Streptomyces sp. NPDC002588]|uniref:hypothetical protein n=1 Tax=Streptomyces sp. NPDC002588 TaxID=3154419 RepID=UPI0033305334
MSTPPPPQNPYGPQPQQSQPPQGPDAPGPYGGPPVPQPYGAAYPPPAHGWVPPPPKSRAPLILGIVGGAVGVVVLGMVALVLIGAKAESDFPDAEYRLTLPRTLLDDRYELADDLSDTEGREIEQEMDGAWDAEVTDSKVGQYSLGGVETDGALLVSGMYGRFQNTDDNRDALLKGVGDAEGLTVTVQPKDFRPGGSDTTVTCEVVTQGAALAYPVCAWADGNTAAVVVEITVAGVGRAASEIDLETAAETTFEIRSETRRPL